MKRTNRTALEPQPGDTQSATDATAALDRLTFALLDEFTCERQGYDPYDTRARKPDVWSSKRKRA